MNEDPKKPVRFGAFTDRWGGEYVGRTEVKEWESHQAEGVALVKKCDELYRVLKSAKKD